MRFVRYGSKGSEKPGVFDVQGRLRDLSDQIPDLSGDVLGRLDTLTADGPVVEATPRLGPPVAGTGKIICIGKNYADHAAETGSEPPKAPLVFMKATSAIAGPQDPFVPPKGADAMDWEIELAAVIGRPASNVAQANALEYLAGYTIMNDLSERNWQWHCGGQYTKGKSGDGFAPLGPWLVTPDEIVDPQDLDLTLSLNGTPRQQGHTGDMIFGLAYLISYLSDFFTLHPGDIIATGTPAGVGAGMDPPRYLQGGDKLHLEIQGLGQQTVTVEHRAKR